MKKYFLIAVSIFVLISLTLIACTAGNKTDTITVTGTIKHLDLDGGFHGIVGDDGQNYNPVELNREFQMDGLKVTFQAQILTDRVKTNRWGTPVKIVWMQDFFDCT